MPTKKRRLGFIPRSDVLEIIDQLSFEHNLSNSKIINILVEEALYKRGIIISKKSQILQNKSKIIVDLNQEQKTRNNYDRFIDEINNNDESKNLSKKEEYAYSLDTEIYKKFILFLQFQEQMKRNNK